MGHLRDTRLERITTPMYRAIKKYGKEVFTIEEIDGANSQSELNYKEWFWIMQYESTNRLKGYNLKSGGANGLAHQSTKDKIRVAALKNGFGKWKRTLSDNKKNSERGKLQFKDPIKRLNFLIANGSREFNVYKAILISPHKRGLKGQEGIKATYEKGEFIGTWLDSKECANYLKLPNHNGITRCLRQERRTYQNYIFEII